MKILMVEDETMTRTALTDILRREGHEVLPCPDGHVAVEALRNGIWDLIITDLNLPGPGGLEILALAREATPPPHVIIMTAYASTESAVEALRRGARDYVIKPFAADELLLRVRNLDRLHSVERENVELKRRIADADGAGRIIGRSACMARLVETIAAVGPGEANILIVGASGTGKELVARALHERSGRVGPFVAVNCAAIPETLVESELFGYRKGAFTGADRDHQGYFRRAAGGSLFIDEIDDLPAATQVKLLRVIQERVVEPIGGNAGEPVDIRLITASKRDLAGLVATGAFREDLFYRLNVIPIRLPGLAERREDIPLLIEHFAARLGHEGSLPIDAGGYRALMDHPWPGNVRELGNLVERMLALPGVPVGDLLDGPPDRASAGRGPVPPVAGDVDYREHMRACEGQLLDWALAAADGNISTAARLLNLPRSTLRSKLDQR